MVTFKVRCPACPELLSFETAMAEFWGQITATDTGCVEVTRPWSPEVEEHLAAHRADGSMIQAQRTRLAHEAAKLSYALERIDAAPAHQGD